MKLIKWEKLPPEMQTDSVRRYYDILAKRKGGLLLNRIFDIVCSLILLLILLPVFLILAIAIKIDSRGPVFYRQERITQYGKKISHSQVSYNGTERRQGLSSYYKQ